MKLKVGDYVEGMIYPTTPVCGRITKIEAGTVFLKTDEEKEVVSALGLCKRISAPQCSCGSWRCFDCTCEWSENNPGKKEFTCEFCGIYTASRPMCNKCQGE